MDDLQFVLIVYGCVFGVTVIATALAMSIMFRRDPSQAVNALKTFYDGGNGLRIATVLTIVSTAGLLGLTDKLEAGVLSLLSGIAGFVLGGLVSSRKANRSDKQTANEARTTGA